MAEAKVERRKMEKAREVLELPMEKSEFISRLNVSRFRVKQSTSFYEDFTLYGIRVNRVELGLVVCSFKVPHRLTVRSSSNPNS